MSIKEKEKAQQFRFLPFICFYIFKNSARRRISTDKLNKKSLYSRVPGCQISMYYYVGFAYMMMRRYADAIRTFSNILLYIQRTRGLFQVSLLDPIIHPLQHSFYQGLQAFLLACRTWFEHILNTDTDTNIDISVLITVL